MKWNWEHKEWPKFSFQPEKYQEYERQFLLNSGVFQGTLKHIQNPENDILLVEVLSDEALNTSAIEGEVLRRESLQSSIRKQFGIGGKDVKASKEEEGVSFMMASLYKTYQEPLTRTMLFEWHKKLLQYESGIESVGAYRRHEDPMQIVSGALGKRKLHFEAPPSSIVQQEMDRFFNWFNLSVDSGELSPLIRSGLAHLYFESIHPFEDGNGRIGRAISQKALSQSLNQPMLLALSATIEADRKAYYNALNRNSFNLQVDDWLAYYCVLILEAQQRTQSLFDFTIEKRRFYQRFASELNERQAKVVARIFKEGLGGFKGGLSAANYQRITGTTASTATRDLQNLVKIGALLKKGERKSTRYFLKLEAGN